MWEPEQNLCCMYFFSPPPSCLCVGPNWGLIEASYCHKKESDLISLYYGIPQKKKYAENFWFLGNFGTSEPTVLKLFVGELKEFSQTKKNNKKKRSSSVPLWPVYTKKFHPQTSSGSAQTPGMGNVISVRPELKWNLWNESDPRWPPSPRDINCLFVTSAKVPDEIKQISAAFGGFKGQKVV